MKELLDTLQGWQGEGIDVGRAVVVRTFGSAPRPEGAVLLYASDGRIAGSVSGGCVEGAAAEEIEKARADGHARVIRYGISDEQAWDVGLACGGTIDVLVEPVVPSSAVTAAMESLGPGGRGTAVVTPPQSAARPSARQPSGRRDPRSTAAITGSRYTVCGLVPAAIAISTPARPGHPAVAASSASAAGTAPCAST